MQELEFKLWLKKNNYPQKMQYDIVSRIKSIERNLDYIDIDDEYTNDKCQILLECFKNKGINPFMKNFKNSKLPIGNSKLRIYKYALKQYLKYKQ